MITSVETLKTYFQTGDTTQAQFENLIDSCYLVRPINAIYALQRYDIYSSVEFLSTVGYTLNTTITAPQDFAANVGLAIQWIISSSTYKLFGDMYFVLRKRTNYSKGIVTNFRPVNPASYDQGILYLTDDYTENTTTKITISSIAVKNSVIYNYFYNSSNHNIRCIISTFVNGYK